MLQERRLWESFLEKDIIPKNNSCELYFEESDLEGFVEKMETLYPAIEYVNKLMTHSWGQKVVRFYDLDGNLIEVGSPIQSNNSTHKTLKERVSESGISIENTGEFDWGTPKGREFW